MAKPHAALGFLVEPLDGAGLGHEAAAEDLDSHGLTAVDPLAPVNPCERPFGQVEQNLVAAEDEAIALPLLEPLDLPARHGPLAQQRPDDGVERPFLRIRPRLEGLFARDQPQQRRLFEELERVELGHGRGVPDQTEADAGQVRPAIPEGSPDLNISISGRNSWYGAGRALHCFKTW